MSSNAHGERCGSRRLSCHYGRYRSVWRCCRRGVTGARQRVMAGRRNGLALQEIDDALDNFRRAQDAAVTQLRGADEPGAGPGIGDGPALLPGNGAVLTVVKDERGGREAAGGAGHVHRPPACWPRTPLPCHPAASPGSCPASPPRTGRSVRAAHDPREGIRRRVFSEAGLRNGGIHQRERVSGIVGECAPEVLDRPAPVVDDEALGSDPSIARSGSSAFALEQDHGHDLW